MAEHNLVAKLSLDSSEFQKGLKEASSSLEQTGKKMTGIGKGLTAGVSAPLIAIGGFALKTAMDYDEAMDKIRVGTGATGDTLKGLGDTFKNVMGTVPTDITSASTAIADLNTRTGQTGQGLQTLATQLLNVSRLTGTDISANVAATTRLFGDWSVATDKQSSTLDYLFKVSQSTGISFTDLSNKMVQFGAPLRQMGFDFETSSALMGKWEKEGVNSELVLGSMRIALTRMAQEGVTNANEALTIMIDKIQNAGSTGEANALAIELFGARAGPDMAAAIREGRFEIDNLVASLKSSSETINQATQDTMGFDEKLDIMKNRIGTAILPLGEKLLSVAEKSLLPALEKGINFVSNLTDKFENLPAPMQNVVLGFGGIAIAVGPALMALGQFLPLIGNITKVLKATSATSWTTMGIIGGLILGAILIYENWDKISAFLTKTWNWIKSTAENIWGGIKDFFQKTWDSIKTTTENTWSKIGNFFSNTWKSMSENTKKSMSDIKEYIGSQMKEVENISKTSLSLVKDLFSGNWEGIKTDLGKIWDSIKKMFDNFLQLICNALGINLDNLKKIVNEEMTAIKNIFSKAWETIVVDTLEWIENLIKDIANWFKKLPGMIWDNIKDIGETIAKPFEWAYDKIVGHSIVPDFVGQVKYWFTELAKILDILTKTGLDKAIKNFQSLDVNKLKNMKEFFEFIAEWKVLDIGKITSNFRLLISELGTLSIELNNQTKNFAVTLVNISVDLKMAFDKLNKTFGNISIDLAMKALNELKSFFDYLENWTGYNIKKIVYNFKNMIQVFGSLGLTLLNETIKNTQFLILIGKDLKSALLFIDEAFKGISLENANKALGELKAFFDFLNEWISIDIKKVFNNFSDMIKTFGALGLLFLNEVIKNTGNLILIGKDLKSSLLFIDEAFKGIELTNANKALGELKSFFDFLNNWVSIDIPKVFYNFRSMIKELGALGILFNQELQKLAVFVNSISNELHNSFAILNHVFDGITIDNANKALGEIKTFFDLLGNWVNYDVAKVIYNFRSMITNLGTLGSLLNEEIQKLSSFISNIGLELNNVFAILNHAFEGITLEGANRAIKEIKDFVDLVNSFETINIDKFLTNFRNVITQLGQLGVLLNQEIVRLSDSINKISVDLNNAFAILNKAFEGISTQTAVKGLNEIKAFLDVLKDFPVINVQKVVADFKKMITNLGTLGTEMKKVLAGDLLKGIEGLKIVFAEINKAFEGMTATNLTSFLKELLDLIGQLELLGTKSIANVKPVIEKLFKDIYDLFVSKEWQDMKKTILQNITEVSNQIKLSFENMGNLVVEKWKEVIDRIKAKVQESISVIEPQLTGYSERVKNAFVGDIQVIQNEWTRAIDTVKSATNEFKQQIDEMLQFLKAVATGEGIDSSGIQKTFEYLSSYVSDLVNRLYENIFKPVLEGFANALMKIPEAIETTLMHMMDIAKNKLVGMIAELAKYFTETWWAALNNWLRMWENAFKDFMSKANQFKYDFLSWLRKFIFDINLAFTDLINPFIEWVYYLEWILVLLGKMKSLLENMPKIPSPPVVPVLPGPEPQPQPYGQSFNINHLEVKSDNAQELVDELVKMGRLYAY